MTVRKSGPVFNSRFAIPKAIDEAIKAVATRGVAKIYRDTPVRTGNLTNGWYATSRTIENQVHYGWFVEKGTRHFDGRWMVRRNIKSIQEDLERTVGKNVEARLQ